MISKLADQRLLEASLYDTYGVKTEFKTLEEINRNAVMMDVNGKPHLVLQQSNVENIIVSVAYFRAGYSPDDYPSEKQWNARRMIEASPALKCPNIGYQFAGSKAIQATLCKPGLVEVS